MKKFLRLAAVGIGSIAIALMVVAWSGAAEFDNYPDNVKIWQSADTLRVRTGGAIQVAAPFAYAGTSGGSVTALTLTPTCAWTAVTTSGAGTPVLFTAHTTNTGALTLAISGLTAKAVVEAKDMSALDGGDITEGDLCFCVWNGASFVLVCPD